MKNLLALAAFVVILFVGVGYFRGWYNVKSTPTNDGQNRVIIDINSQKIKQDLDQGKEKLKKMLDTNDGPGNTPATDKQSGTGQPGKAGQTQNTPPTGQPAPNQNNTVQPQYTNDGFFVLPGQTPPPPPMNTSPSKTAPRPDPVPWFFPDNN